MNTHGFLKWLFAVVVTVGGLFVMNAQAAVPIDIATATANLRAFAPYADAVKDISPPRITKPQWYSDQVATERAARARVTVTYTIITRGDTRSDLTEFAAQAQQTLSSPRGWSQLGIVFKRIPSGGSFQLVLSEASQVPTFSSACSAQWSCRVGSSVIINDDRWSGATDAWNGAKGSLRDYRHMVINHEVGHWLGHGHAACAAPGMYAPIMLQQSISLQGV